VKYSELAKKLRRLGIEFRRQARGSHEIWWNPKRKLYTVIPNHPGKEIKKKTLAGILRDLDLKKEDLEGRQR
jgi:predicted RNA binding protein YcfA (HicA-like mRNA interferase family)